MPNSDLYELILGRPPGERELRAVAGDEADLRIIARALLSSHEFLVQTVEPLLDGTLPVETAAAPEALQRWAEASFGLATGPAEPRLAVLARALDGPLLNSVVRSTDVIWSAGALKAAVHSAIYTQGESQTSLVDAVEAARGVTRGLYIDALAGLEIGRQSREFQLSGRDASIMFRLLDAPRADDAVCRIDFGLLTGGDDAQSSLYIDYGGGFDDALVLPLMARGRPRYAAFLASPRQIRALRWDIAPLVSTLKLTLLTARSVHPRQLLQQLEAIGGARGQDWLAGKRLPHLRPGEREPQAFRLSRVLTRELGGHSVGRSYPDWLADHEPAEEVAEPLWITELAALHRRPGIDIFVVVDNGDPRLLRQTADSLRRQIYPHWTLYLASAGSDGYRVRAVMADLAAEDSRLATSPRTDHTSATAALNASLGHATGDWMAVLAPGDLLRPDALLKVAMLLADKPHSRIVYSDHDELDATGLRSNPAFKPQFSPETLLGRNYLERLVMFRTADIRAFGGWRHAFNCLDDYEWALRILETVDSASTDIVQHIPHVLLHRRHRLSEGSFAEPIAKAAAEIVSAHLSRRRVKADVECLTTGLGQRIRHHLPDPKPQVSLIMPTRDRADILEISVKSILNRTTYSPFELIIIDNDSVETATHALLEELCLDSRVRVLKYPGIFNYSAINNFAVAQSSGEIIGLINNDIEVISQDWLQDFVSWSILPKIGCVGAKLYYPDGRIQHGGVIIGINGVAAHSHKYFPKDATGFGARLALVHNISAVTGACLFIRKKLYECVGGLNESLKVAFNDVDFCLTLDKIGYRNLLNPFSEIIHHESASRGADDTPEKSNRFMQEVNFMKNKWGAKLDQDPYYSPNLTKVHENFDFDWQTKRGD